MSNTSSECIDGKRGVSEPKKPCRGILKNSSSFDKAGSGFASYRKTAKFDEANVQKTYHPLDKDYGHMKVNEPKTPFVYSSEDDPGHDFDPDLLAEKLRIAADTQTPQHVYDENSEEDFTETPTERVLRSEFERRRKAHYNEFKAVMLARKLIQVELENDDETVDGTSVRTCDGTSCESECTRSCMCGRGIITESMDVGSSTS